jgi:hypothetical protein
MNDRRFFGYRKVGQGRLGLSSDFERSSIFWLQGLVDDMAGVLIVPLPAVPALCRL